MYRFPMTSAANAGLTIAQLGERTGLPPGTLRMWEARHGFPEPARLPGGHRRYDEDDVALVLEVLRLRDQGLSLASAVDRARARRRPAGSIFAGLRGRRADVAPVILPKRAVLVLSRAIEDEYCARAGAGAIVGSFQRERFYRRSERRWRDLAQTADVAVALADFAAPAARPDAPVEMPVERHHPLAREWAVVVSAGEAQACLAAWEQPSASELADRARRFEVLWSFDPSVVGDAVEVAVELLRPLDPALAERVARAADSGGPSAASALDGGGALAQRMVGYLGRLLERDTAVLS
jgi:DICT domain-containing protein